MSHESEFLNLNSNAGCFIKQDTIDYIKNTLDTLVQKPFNTSLNYTEFGRFAKQQINETRNKIYNLLKISPDEYDIIFNSGASECLTTVFNAIFMHSLKFGIQNILLGNAEHPTLYRLFDKYAKFGTIEGSLYNDQITPMLLDFVILSPISTTTGLEINTVEFFRELKLKNQKVITIADCTQVIPRKRFDITNCDIMLFSSHKFGALPGTGVLIIKKSVYQRCYDPDRGLIADSPERSTFSQHANVLAVLTNTFPETADKTEIINKILNDKELAKCTLYFSFYLFEALEKVGQANQFTSSLVPWQQMLDAGLTTFAEIPGEARSDCHAWSASPVYYFLSLVSGIKPASPGFDSVRIEPNPGSLSNIDATMPHRLGAIHVKLQKDKDHLSGEITLPMHLEGVFIWNGEQRPLQGGINRID